MTENALVMVVMALVFGTLGFVLLSSHGLASWGINNLRSGQRWARWFGEERAIRILRFVAGPILILVSGFGVWMAVSGNIPS